jgi:hypothetical protein
VEVLVALLQDPDRHLSAENSLPESVRPVYLCFCRFGRRATRSSDAQYKIRPHTPTPHTTLERPPVSALWALQGSHCSRLALCARLGMKSIGKPCAGNPHARFDEGGQETPTRVGLLRHRQTKGAATDRLSLRDAESCSLLYPIMTRLTTKT